MIERSASFPTFFMSSPCPAIPTTSVAKSNGAINDLIMFRKIVAIGLRLTAKPGASHPSSTPTTIEMMIQWVSETRRKELAIELSGERTTGTYSERPNQTHYADYAQSR